MSEGHSATATPPAPAAVKPRPKKNTQRAHLPPFKVLLHNDDVNTCDYVVETLIELVHFTEQEATLKMLEAHEKGIALLLVTHREKAELLQEQFQSKKLTVTIEPAE